MYIYGPYSLGESKSVEAIPFLIEYLKSGRKNERRLAASALKKLSVDHKNECKNAVPYLLSCIQKASDAPQVRQYALAALKAIGAPINARKILKDVIENDRKENNVKSARNMLAELDNDPNSLIWEIAEEKKIRYLFHFTQADNLESIMKHGLLPRQQLSAFSIPFKYNDELRLDRHPETVSLSISFTNYQMFYKCRKKIIANWVVLVYKPDILWQIRCAFCKHNAADKRITSIPVDKLCSPAAFNGMFLEIHGLPSRADQNLRDDDPTDPQAEVLVFGSIPNSMLMGVIFIDEQSMNEFETKYLHYRTWIRSDGSSIFGKRQWMRERG